MTVCIAAICREDKESRIVVCADKRAGSVLGNSETAMKLRPIGKNWQMLTAGGATDIEAIHRLYGLRFASFTPDYANIDENLKAPFIDRKRALANDFTQGKFGLSYQDFLALGKEKLPNEIFVSAMQKISALDCGCELILTGFIGSFPEVYQAEASGKVTPVTDFAVIGEGAYLAAASLMRRQQDTMTSLEQTLYNVFEAKTYAEGVGSVGKATTLAIVEPVESGAKVKFVSVQLLIELESMVGKYGPKQLPDDLKFESKLYSEKQVHLD